MDLNALDKKENLTPFSYNLVNLAISPFDGKIIILETMFSYQSSIVTIAASINKVQRSFCDASEL